VAAVGVARGGHAVLDFRAGIAGSVPKAIRSFGRDNAAARWPTPGGRAPGGRPVCCLQAISASPRLDAA